MATKKDTVIIRPVEKKQYEFTIVGNTPLITHAWSEKNKKEIREKQTMKKTGKKKDLRNPIYECLSSMFWVTPELFPKSLPTAEDIIKNGYVNLDGSPDFISAGNKILSDLYESGARWGFRPEAIVKSAASAAADAGMIKYKVNAMRAMFLYGVDRDFNVLGNGELSEIIIDRPPVIREDNIRLSGVGRVADLRYRAEFDGWSMNFVMEYNTASDYSRDALLNMIEYAGCSNGIGEYRQEKGGIFGRYEIKKS